MAQARRYETNAERQAAYREREKVRDAEWAAAQERRQQEMWAALEDLERVVLYGARLGDGDCRALADLCPAGKIARLTRWLKEGAERGHQERK